MAKHIHVHYHDRKSGDSAPHNEDALREIEEALSKATSESHLRELLARVPGLSASEVRHAVASYKNKKTGDATNHLGEKEYYTFRRWKEAVKAAYPNARFEGDQDMCNAVPGGEWDGEKGVVYAKKTGDASYNQQLLIDLPKRIQALVTKIDSYKDVRNALSNAFGRATTLSNKAKRMGEKEFESSSTIEEARDLFDVVVKAEQIVGRY